MTKNLVLFLSALAAFAVCGGAIGAASAVEFTVVERPRVVPITLEKLDPEIREKFEKRGYPLEKITEAIDRYNRLNAIAGGGLPEEFVVSKLSRISPKFFEKVTQNLTRFIDRFFSEPIKRYLPCWIESLIKHVDRYCLDLDVFASETYDLVKACVDQRVDLRGDEQNHFSFILNREIGNIEGLVRKSKEVSRALNMSFYEAMTLSDNYRDVAAKKIIEVIGDLVSSFKDCSLVSPGKILEIRGVLRNIPISLWGELSWYLKEHPEIFKDELIDSFIGRLCFRNARAFTTAYQLDELLNEYLVTYQLNRSNKSPSFLTYLGLWDKSLKNANSASAARHTALAAAAATGTLPPQVKRRCRPLPKLVEAPAVAPRVAVPASVPVDLPESQP